MLQSSGAEDVRWYLQGAKNVMGILQKSLAICGKEMSSLSSCLEIGSGYGRIIRHVSGRIQPANVFACDAIEEASHFCSEEFGINCVPCRSLSEARNHDRFELIYLISVFSHLDSVSIANLWAKIVTILKPGGVVVFTTQGNVSAGQSERYGNYWAAKKSGICEALLKSGYFYEKYKWYEENLGMTWVREDFLRDLLEDRRQPREMVQFRRFEEGALDGHQDVYTYQKI
jgi:SAM-dependent methyltransferase